jgi:hypothetical protein
MRLLMSPTQMHKASKLVDSFFFAPKERDMIQDDAILHKQLPSHHLPVLICGFFGGEKNLKFLFPTAMEENIAHVNLLRKPSNSSILMAIDAIDAIFLDQVNP